MTLDLFIKIAGLLGIPSVLGAFIKFELTKLAYLKQQQEAIQKGVVALLRDRMYQLYNLFNTKGTATVEEKEQFEDLYVEYKALGGNGVMTSIHQKVMSM